MKSSSHSLLVVATLASALASSKAHAFCGFYVSGSAEQLSNGATEVVLFRSGNRTVLSMQNNYQGPPENFAMVVPVPVVLQQENVKTLSRDVFQRVDEQGAPRLVEYWEQDPCNLAPDREGSSLLRGSLGSTGIGMGGATRPTPFVRVEAQFVVGEYEVVVLSSNDSSTLETWLKTNQYHIPDQAAAALEPYVRVGMKFFVAKVDVSKIAMVDHRATLSPLRFHYDTPDFSLPVRLGLLNSPGTQDLIINILADKRYEVRNRSNLRIPTNLEVTEAVRSDFATFYNALFDRTVAQQPDAVITEYAWSANSCDPCPDRMLTFEDVVSLGGDVLNVSNNFTGFGISLGGSIPNGPSAVVSRIQTHVVSGRLSEDVVRRVLLRQRPLFQSCYNLATRVNPTFEGEATVDFTINGNGVVGPGIRTAVTKGTQPVIATTCLQRMLGRMRFPPDTVETKVQMTLNYATVAPSQQVDARDAGAAPSLPSLDFGSLVLTRLHLRYDKTALRDDLVFGEASPIEGGRGAPSGTQALALDETSHSGSINNFQARYIIRHAWSGPIQCATPTRGVWGSNPNHDSAGAKPAVATGLAFAPRSAATLNSMLVSAAPSPSVSAPSHTQVDASSVNTSLVDASTTSPPSSVPPPKTPAPSKGCGSCQTQPTSPKAWSFALLATLGFALTRRKRSSV